MLADFSVVLDEQWHYWVMLVMSQCGCEIPQS